MKILISPGAVTLSDAHKPEGRHEPHFKGKETEKLHDLVRVAQPIRNQIRPYPELYVRLSKALSKLLLNHRKLIQFKVQHFLVQTVLLNKSD